MVVFSVRKILVFAVLGLLGIGAWLFIFQDHLAPFSGSTNRLGDNVGTSDSKGGLKGSSSAAKSSVIVKKVESGELGPVVLGPRRTVPESASPMDRPSADELKRFPTAKVLMAGSVAGPGVNQVTQVRILDTDFKYPHVRTEEVIDQSTGQVLYREEMVADHLLATLAEGQDPAALLAAMGGAASSVERISTDVPLYRVHLSNLSL